MHSNPLTERPETDVEDLTLLSRIREGDRDALEGLLMRHQPWIIHFIPHRTLRQRCAACSLSRGSRRFWSCAAMTESAQIIAMERAALDRWGNGDPQGYLEIMAPEVTYFDPTQDTRVDGLASLRDLLEPWTGKIWIDSYQMVNPVVQVHGDAAILTFNLVNYRKAADGSEQPFLRWNSTEVYSRIDGRWRIVHSHWSYVKPDLKQPVSELA